MSAIFTFFFIFATSFTRTLFNDLHDIQRDMVVGRETLPILIGNHFSKVFPAVPAMFITLLIVSAVLTSVWSPATLLLLLSPVWTMISSNMFKRGKLEDETFFDAIIDFSFVLPALILFFIQN
jgi:4-hydroxy-3-methylbut-2-enyl diphosphate reductase